MHCGFSTAKVVTRTRYSVTSYVHCLSHLLSNAAFLKHVCFCLHIEKGRRVVIWWVRLEIVVGKSRQSFVISSFEGAQFSKKVRPIYVEPC
jgi:hypothetical protein